MKNFRKAGEFKQKFDKPLPHVEKPKIIQVVVEKIVPQEQSLPESEKKEIKDNKAKIDKYSYCYKIIDSIPGINKKRVATRDCEIPKGTHQSWVWNKPMQYLLDHYDNLTENELLELKHNGPVIKTLAQLIRIKHNDYDEITEEDGFELDNIGLTTEEEIRKDRLIEDGWDGHPKEVADLMKKGVKVRTFFDDNGHRDFAREFYITGPKTRRGK